MINSSHHANTNARVSLRAGSKVRSRRLLTLLLASLILMPLLAPARSAMAANYTTCINAMESGIWGLAASGRAGGKQAKAAGAIRAMLLGPEDQIDKAKLAKHFQAVFGKTGSNGSGHLDVVCIHGD
jgi:hypothetical protein